MNEGFKKVEVHETRRSNLVESFGRFTAFGPLPRNSWQRVASAITDASLFGKKRGYLLLPARQNGKSHEARFIFAALCLAATRLALPSRYSISLALRQFEPSRDRSGSRKFFKDERPSIFIGDLLKEGMKLTV